MPAKVTERPLGICCTFSDGSNCERHLEDATQSRLYEVFNLDAYAPKR